MRRRDASLGAASLRDGVAAVAWRCSVAAEESAPPVPAAAEPDNCGDAEPKVEETVIMTHAPLE